MALDLKQWLTEMGVKPDAIDGILPALADAAPNIEKGTLRLSDYSREMDGLRAKQTALDTANERVNQELIDIAEARSAGEPITAEMRNALAKAQGEVTRLSTVLTTRASELGLDPKTILGEVPPPADDSARRTVPPPSLDGYARSDDLNARVAAMGTYVLDLMADLPAIQHEHHMLTGEFLDPRAVVTELKRRATDPANRNRDNTFKQPADLRAIWEESHQIGEKRTARATADLDAKLKDAETRGYERARTEQTLPGEHAPGRHSPVLRQAGDPARQQKMQTPQNRSNTRISQAASALATHRYADGKRPGAAA